MGLGSEPPWITHFIRSCIGTGRSKWLWSCNHKNIGTFFHYNRSMGGTLERVWLIKRGFIFCFLVSFIMGLGQLSLLLTWSFIEITILIIIPLLRFNHLHNSLVLKYFLVQSIGSITLLTRLIFYLDFLIKNLYSCFSLFGKWP